MNQEHTDLARRCAVALGWERSEINGVEFFSDGAEHCWEVVEDGWTRFSPCTKRTHAALLLADVERRGIPGMRDLFILNLLNQCGVSVADRYEDVMWRLATATPEQITRAYLATVEGAGL